MEYPISISVIMPTYNTELPMLKEAVDSILNQTFQDFEFLIIDDGSANGSDAYLKSIGDERVKIIWNQENVGVTKSLNIGLKAAKGKYIARMDADDLSLPARLEKEYAFMEAHPDVIACGALAGTIDEDKNVRMPNTKVPKDMEEYRVRMLFVNPGPIHPTAMFRHEKLAEHHIQYDEKLIYAQDYGIWEAISHFGKIATIEEPLLYRRKHEGQISIAKRDVQIRCDKMTQKKILSALLGEVTDAEIDLHYSLSTGNDRTAIISPEAAAWYDRLLQANKTRRIYDQKKLEARVITLKKNLIRQTLKENMSAFEKSRLIFRYLPFQEGLRMIAGMIRQKNHP